MKEYPNVLKIWIMVTLLLGLCIMVTVVAGVWENAGTEIDRASTDGGVIHTTEHIYKPLFWGMVWITITVGIIDMIISILIIMVYVDAKDFHKEKAKSYWPEPEYEYTPPEPPED